VVGVSGALVRGVARLEPASILIVGSVVVYASRYLTRRKPPQRRPVKVSDARLYSRCREITTTLEGAGVVQKSQETPEEYARRASEALGEPGIARLGEIYLHARFRDAVPAELTEEFDRLEPEAFAPVERLKAAEIVRE
jgi:Domain of unknown function (DUF4129)